MFNEWKDFPELKGKHSFLSPSKWHWINYDDGRLIEAYNNSYAAARGSELHEFAAQAIKLGIPLKNDHSTLSMHVNDAIKYRMRPEQILYFSDKCFGTADAICYRNGVLRIHDLKTGMIPAHIEQLMLYAAMFCLMYEEDPFKMRAIELRIYQNDNVTVCTPTPAEVKNFIDIMVHANNVVKDLTSIPAMDFEY